MSGVDVHLDEELVAVVEDSARAGCATGDVETRLAVAGRDVPGAAVIVPRRGEVPAARYERVGDRDVAERLRSGSLGDHGGSSLPGVQPKGAVALLGGRWHLPRGSAASTHSLEPSRPDAPELVHDEAATSSAAAACGAEAAPTRRTAPAPSRSPRTRSTPSSSGAARPAPCEAWRRCWPATGGDRTDLLRQLTVRVLVGDTDGHVKHHGFLHRGDGSVGLAPLYDASPHGQHGATRLAPSSSRCASGSSAGRPPPSSTDCPGPRSPGWLSTSRRSPPRARGVAATREVQRPGRGRWAGCPVKLRCIRHR